MGKTVVCSIRYFHTSVLDPHKLFKTIVFFSSMQQMLNIVSCQRKKPPKLLYFSENESEYYAFNVLYTILCKCKHNGYILYWNWLSLQFKWKLKKSTPKLKFKFTENSLLKDIQNRFLVTENHNSPYRTWMEWTIYTHIWKLYWLNNGFVHPFVEILFYLMRYCFDHNYVVINTFYCETNKKSLIFEFDFSEKFSQFLKSVTFWSRIACFFFFLLAIRIEFCWKLNQSSYR